MIDYLFDTEKKRIGVAKIGGLGDTIQLLILTSAIKRKYPDSIITIYIRDKFPNLEYCPFIDHIVVTGYCNWNELVKKEAPRYDLFFDDRYIVGKWVNGELQLHPDTQHVYWNIFRYLSITQGNLLQKSAYTAEVTLQEEDFDISWVIQNPKFELVLKDYIVLHHGDDELRHTKSYPDELWTEVIENIDKPVIQVGIKDNPPVVGAIDLRGLTTFEELVSLIRGANCVLTQEGVCAHIARCVDTPAFVVYGSTTADNFGYEENINIEHQLECKGCWYKTSNWYNTCHKNYKQYCEGIRTIPPERIKEELFQHGMI